MQVYEAMPLRFAVTFDYRCPFACNLHEHLADALEAGADWSVRFIPFSLGQAHVREGEPDVWDNPDADTGIVAMQVGIAVRDHFPDRFLHVHRGLFHARHREGRPIKDPDVVRAVLAEQGLDPDEVWAHLEDGSALRTIRSEHETAVARHKVWGVPTIIAGEQAVFIRLMNGSDGDPARSQAIVERLVGLIQDWPELNEFKHTSLAC
ncbi:MAG: DsbA family protein [Acidimicrobiales bacterium]|nr:DsbA family protein [Acidimicrobiales bacterium]